MEDYCYYYDKDTDEFIKYNKYSLSSMSKNEPDKLIVIRNSLYKEKDLTCQLQLVLGQGGRFGLRKKSNNQSSQESSERTKNKSIAHQYVQEALSKLSKLEFLIRSTNEKIQVTINKIEKEKEVIINGKKYYTDLYLEIGQCESNDSIFPSKFYLEIVDTHDLDEEKIIDFRLEGLTIVRYKITERFKEFHNTNQYNKVDINLIDKIKKTYSRFPMLVDLIHNAPIKKLDWKTSKKGNEYLRLNNNAYTIVKDGNYYVILKNKNNIKSSMQEYNGKKFKDIEYTKKVVEYIVNEVSEL